MSLQLQEQSVLTQALNSGALAVGSTTSQVAIGTAINYVFKGVFGQRATAATIAYPCEPGTGAPQTPNAYTTLAPGQACAFALVINPAAANALTGVQGPIVAAGEKCPVPAVPHDRVLIGAAKVVTVTNPFIPGTTNLNAAGVTTTAFNLATHPGAAL